MLALIAGAQSGKSVIAQSIISYMLRDNKQVLHVCNGVHDTNIIDRYCISPSNYTQINESGINECKQNKYDLIVLDEYDWLTIAVYDVLPLLRTGGRIFVCSSYNRETTRTIDLLNVYVYPTWKCNPDALPQEFVKQLTENALIYGCTDIT